MRYLNEKSDAHTHVARLALCAAFCNAETMDQTVRDLRAASGHSGIPTFEPIPSEPVYSSFGAGGQIVDHAARERIEAQHAALNAAGVKVDAGEQFYATGTRMAREGYAAQDSRKHDHEALRPLHDAAHALVSRVQREQRSDRTFTARELGESVESNGKLKVAGFAMHPQAIRGLLQRVESPATSYVFGLRDRIAREFSKPEGERNADQIAADKAMLADVLRRELRRAPDAEIKLRTQAALGACFAAVSPTYAPADAPEVVGQILDALPRDAKGTFRYDPVTTSWEIQASIWTPTPTAEQAVGEPFRGYATLGSRDNGTGPFWGGGGIELLRCLNASVYTADGPHASRRHVGRILDDAREILRAATAAIEILARAWGTARQQVIEVPSGVALQDLIPDLFTSLLRDGRELAGVLPGRSRDHAERLASIFPSERRVSDVLVKSDVAQAWTRYAQELPGDVRSDAERAIGDWLVSGKEVRIAQA